MRSGLGAARRKETQMEPLFSFEAQKRCSESHGNRRLVRVNSFSFAIGLAVAFCILPSLASAQANAPSTPSPAGESQVQLVQPPGPGQSGPPITMTLKDALERARQNDPFYLGAVSDSKSAHEDRLQARNALLPSVTARTEYLGTQGNGVTPNGRYVTNDGVHVYRAWGILHMDLS